MQFFGKPRDELTLEDDDVEALREYLEFEPNPSISRVIFIATPHRGSNKADLRIVGLIRKLIKMPVDFLDPTFGKDDAASEKQDTLELMADAGIPTSLHDLSPTSNFVKNCIDLPMRPGLQVHSIIGNKRNHPLTSPKSGDGIVPYSSAHLKGVQSELVVQSGHSAHGTPQAIAEIKRILKLHLHSQR